MNTTILEKIPWSKIIVSCIIIWSIVALPMRHGDGHEYSLTTKALRMTFSPEITVDVVKERIKDIQKFPSNGYSIELFENVEKSIINGDSGYMGVYRDLSGHYYGYHFFTYSILVAITEFAIEQLGLNVLASFQLTNGLITIICVMLTTSWLGKEQIKQTYIYFVILASGTIFYLQWSHPEVYLFCAIFISVVGLLQHRWRSSLMFAAVAACQTISFGALVLFIILYFLPRKIRTFSSGEAMLAAVYLFSIGLLSGISAIFYYIHFGTISIISTIPLLVDPDFVTLGHLASIYMDLDQGMWVGAPWLVGAGLWLVVARCRGKLANAPWRQICSVIIMSLLIVVPILAHSNVNSGSSVFQRYAFWAAAPVAAWVTAKGGEYFRGPAAGFFQALAIAWMGAWGGPLAAEDYLTFKPWTRLVLTHLPFLYVGEPGVFFERATAGMFDRGAAYGGWDSRGNQPAAFVDRHGTITKVLAPPLSRSSEWANNLCTGTLGGPSLALASGNVRRDAGFGWAYIDGPFQCVGAILNSPVVLQIDSEGNDNDTIEFNRVAMPKFVSAVSGFSGIESWGRWTVGHVSAVVFAPEFRSLVVAEVHATVFDKYEDKIIQIKCNEQTSQINAEEFGSGPVKIPCGSVGVGKKQYIQFVLPGAVSPSKRFVSADSRVLGLAVRKIVIH